MELQQPKAPLSELQSNVPLSDSLDPNLPAVLKILSSWRKTAAYSGMNPTIRLGSSLPSIGQKDRHQLCIILYAYPFVALACLTAFTHSFFSIGHYSLGCRALAWILIFVVWVLSFIVDQLL
jgi:hypothetical protein